MSTYMDMIEALANGRKLTAEQLSELDELRQNDPFYADLPPMRDERNQRIADAEQAARFRAAAAAQRALYD